MLKKFLARLSYRPLIICAIILGLAPFSPAPHVVEKLQMLIHGDLHRLIDIFDLFFHLFPTFLLVAKWVAERKG
jgi:hypothetical protein